MSPDAEPPELPVGQAVAADQAAAHAAGGHHEHGPFHSHCENCGTRLEGPWCYRCGQHDFEFHRSFWHVFLEGLESFLHFDSKLFRTIATLLFRPGRLTADFNAGKRVAQMPPLRLYIFVSLVFFFLLFLDNKTAERLVDSGVAPAARPGPAAHGPAKKPVAFTVGGQPASLDQAVEQAVTQLKADPARQERAVDRLRHAADQVRAVAEQEHAAREEKAGPAGAEAAPNRPASRPRAGEEPASPYLRWLRAQAERAAEPEHQREMVDHFMHSLPKMLLFCLPFFALYTRVLFRQSRQVYLQHLVLALHFHTLFLLWSMTKDGWVFLGGLAGAGLAGLIDGAFRVWLLLYPFLMFRHLFANGWFKTILKTGLLFLAYALTLMFAALIGGFIIFATL